MLLFIFQNVDCQCIGGNILRRANAIHQQKRDKKQSVNTAAGLKPESVEKKAQSR